MTDGPLSGVRVLDLTHVLAGPYATGQLALMGAEVIRVERPGGDDFVRRHGGTEAMREAGFGASFLSQNSGKKSVVLDLKQASDRARFLDLAERADIVVENFRPGVVDRLGVGFEAVRARRADAIFASLTGYGQDGPLSGRPAYDHILQGISGLMAMTGAPESGPMRVGLPIVDYVAGQALVQALLGALLQRARRPGEAQRLSVSMLDAMTAFMGPYAIQHETTRQLRGLEGNRAFADTPFSGRFDTADGALVVTANSPAQAARLCAALGRPDLPESADVAGDLAAIFRTRSADDWEEILSVAHVPAARIRTLAEALAHPQMAGSPTWKPLPVPQLGITVRAPALPFDAPWGPEALAPVPAFGEHTDSVLTDLTKEAAE
ncbi:CaiB/BaiF CoA transferase family protein [Jannaschia seohaensis]|uniref:Crotonobetainyl-CoA:carnitine CoA-transferase CaiB n=1 Tax=Jannaschia seohaensis TaxID=475081 RepID=A0A2Y9C3M3_9RHOB|nr:CoA transferase [Jannaschia seohaensis]PWJ21795.1 crotonobetainyl-CoA:carnitine CoA-transferase CaiB-like acyl-CoA transferase [Jannaschia seohaensis]SSA38073.1 Crotonobetainyl-CoA:carnitine CoA-transferase CaiB [Jannaschia seohaensis]